MKGDMAVVPPGGFKFFQRLPNGSMKLFVGTDEDDLVRQVTRFRLDNNIDIGELEKEIKLGISNPSHVVKLEDQRSLRERVTGWQANRAYQALSFVEPEVAAKRAQVCVDCPFNRAKYADDCRECFVHVERNLFAMRQGKSTDQDAWLGACEICGHQNATAVQLDQKHLLHRKNFETDLKEKAPHCWLLKLDAEPATEVA